MEHAALVEWLHLHQSQARWNALATTPSTKMSYLHWLFQDFFVLSTIKLHCMGDLPKYLVRIEWLGYATNANQLISCIQVSIAIAANLVANYASTGRGILLAIA